MLCCLARLSKHPSCHVYYYFCICGLYVYTFPCMLIATAQLAQECTSVITALQKYVYLGRRVLLVM